MGGFGLSFDSSKSLCKLACSRSKSNLLRRNHSNNSLGFTEGISSWKVESLCTFRPLVVPVGRSTLGRLFSVLGATIDAYVGIDELPLYSDYILHFDQCEVEASSTELHRVQSRCAKEEKIIKIRTEEALCATEFLSSSKFIHTSLRNFTYLKEVILQQKTKIAQLKELGSLGFLNIMGVGSEIIKTRESNPLSFSNVSSEAVEAYKVLTIIEYIEGSIG